ncbi:hypothetical protein CAEBREN_09655 [Caenorhabditis brenneri]|uniref:Uncharacterized protein n=1 Tax=Caenorhabditis brenneri TaxID=135651 RepID=G0MGA5_CAEBE|nr:hypothetical protein CAEBREN_09655 [Caenorhabditis brenneri]
MTQNATPKVDRPSPKSVCFDRRKATYLLNESWKFPLNPLYFILKHFCSYTCMFPFFSNIVYWHLLIFAVFRLPFVLYSTTNARYVMIFVHFSLFFMILMPFWANPKMTQKIRDIQWGFVGMLLSCWSLMIAVLIKDVYWEVSHAMYHLSMLMLTNCLFLSASYFTMYYVQPHPEELPYAKPRDYVVFIGILHLVVAVHLIGKPNLLELFSLLIASFFFSVDLFSVWTTKTYMICRHYHYEWQSTPEKELLYNVGKAEIVFFGWKGKGKVIVV